MAQLTRLIVTGGNCTINSAGEVTASSFIKTGSNNNKILLGGGGDIPITTYVSKTDYDKFVNGDTYQRALYKYDGSNKSAADTTLYPNLIAQRAPSMSAGRCNFYFYDTKFYDSQTNTANRTQVAYGYGTPEIFMRTYQSSVWSDWDKILTASELKNSIYDNYVNWTSESVTGLNATSPITAALEPLMFANRLSCYHPAYIVVEESLDKGQTWSVKDVSDDDKVAVFTNDYDAIKGSKKGAFIRITLTAYDLYCDFTKFIIDFSTSGQKSCYCEVQAATNSTPNNFITIGEGEVSGWNYWNTIAVKNDYIFRAFKNDSNSPNAFKKLRFVFTSKSEESSGSGIIAIRHITGIAPMNYFDNVPKRPYASCGSIAKLEYHNGTIYTMFESDISCTGWLRTKNGVYFTNANAGVYPKTIDSQIYLASYNNRPILAENDIVSKGGGFKIYEYKNDKTRILKANGKTAVFNFTHPKDVPFYIWGGKFEDEYYCYDSINVCAGFLRNHGRITAYDKDKQTAEEGGISPIVGLRVAEVYNNGYPCAYGNLIDMRLNGSSQMVMEWNSDKANVYVRSRRDMTVTPWNDWKRLAFADEIPDIASYLKKDGSNAEEVTGSNILNKLSTGTSTPTDADYYISQYANGGSTTTTYHRRPMSSLWNWINSKTIDKAKSVSNNLTIKCGSKTNTYNGSSALTVDVDNSLYEANLKWGGKNFSDGFGPIDAALVPRLGANRFAYAYPNGISVDISTDNGATWTPYPNLTEDMKYALTSEGTQLYLSGVRNTTPVNTAQMRIVFNTKQCHVYTTLNKFILRISTSGSKNSTVSIYKALAETDDYVPVIENVRIEGWSGYDVINVDEFTTYGIDTSSQYGKIKFVFKHEGMHPAFPSNPGLTIYSIYAYGGVGWTCPSTMAEVGTLYRAESRNAIFPRNVFAAENCGFVIYGNQSSENLLTSDGGFVTKTNLLANYATKSWTNSQGFATQAWVNQQGFIKSYTNSWRPIQLKGSQILENTTSSNPLNFAEGANITLTNSNGTITIKSSYTDTKNTAGSTNSTGKLFIVGSAAQSANSQTYSNSKCYIGSDSCLYSNDAKVLTAHQSLADYVKKTTIASATDLGLVKVFMKLDETFGWVGQRPPSATPVPQINYPSFVAGRYYSIITDSHGQAVVNVPWTDTTTFVPVDNSNNVTISLTPNSDNTLNIGTLGKRFASLYVYNIGSTSLPSTAVYSRSFYDTAHSETDVLLGKGKVKSLDSIIYNVTPYKTTNVSGAGNSDSWRSLYSCSLGSGWMRYNRSFIVSGNFGSGILSIEIYGGQITSSSTGNEIYSKQANYSGSISSSFTGVRNINNYFKLYVYRNGTSRYLYLYYNAWNNQQCSITPLEYYDDVTSTGTFNLAAGNVSLPTSSLYDAFPIDSLVETTTSITAEAFYQTSDYRKKDILESLHPKTCLDMCANIDVVKFNYKDDEQHKERIGVIAQDIEQYFPEVVNTDYDGYKSVDYSKLSVIAIRAIKQLKDEIEELRKLIK